MTFRGDTAVLVLAAGPGTRMQSDTPKVLHTLGGRSMLSHSLHAMAKLAPRHLVVVLGHDHQRISPLVGELADTLGRSVDVALQDRPLGTGHAVLCGLSALPNDYAGLFSLLGGNKKVVPMLQRDQNMWLDYRLMYGAGAKVVGGVTPGRKGRDVHGVPVFDTVAQAVELLGVLIEADLLLTAGCGLSQAARQSKGEGAEYDALDHTADPVDGTPWLEASMDDRSSILSRSNPSLRTRAS